MSLQEKRSLTSILSSILILVFYSLYTYQRYQSGVLDTSNIFKFWAVFILILIPVSIVVRIVITILFSIVITIVTKEEDDPSFADERDKLIELKSSQYALYVFSIGFMLAMVTQAINMAPSAMFITLIASGFLSDMVSEISQIYFYRRGF